MSEEKSLSLFDESKKLTEQIISEDDPNKLENLSKLFEVNQMKKNIARINKLSSLLEIVDDEVLNRFACTPEGFDNTELLKYMESTQKAINDMSREMKDVPMVQIYNQTNEINIGNSSGLSQESRKKVMDVVRYFLENSKSDAEVEEDND